MASLNYLWAHRAKFAMTSKFFYKAWAKRLILLPELIRRNNRRSRLVHKGASIHATAEIGEISIGGAPCLLTIGAQSFLGRVNIALHEAVIIGEKVCINDGVVILTASHDVYDPMWNHVKNKIVIDDYVWIGTGAIILPGIHIGKGAVVGAGAVVSKSVPAGSIVVGNPAKPLSKTRTQEFVYDPCAFLAANQAWLKG